MPGRAALQYQQYQQQPLFVRLAAALLLLLSCTPEPEPPADGLSACESLSLTITSFAMEWNTFAAAVIPPESQKRPLVSDCQHLRHMSRLNENQGELK
jgi:hypothetical protein